jgi:hypothetical protein
MQLDQVARRILEECLQACPDRGRVADAEALVPQLVDRGGEIVDKKREVLAVTLWWLALDQVNLLATGIEPGTRETEVRSISALLEAEHRDVEIECRLDIVDIDRNVMHGPRLHGARGY